MYAGSNKNGFVFKELFAVDVFANKICVRT